MHLLLTITLLIMVAVIVLLHWLNIITLTGVATSERSLTKWVMMALDDPKVSAAITLTVTVLFIVSNSLTTTLLVIVSVIFSFHWFNVVTLTHYFPSAFDPKISGAVTVTITAYLTLTNSLMTTFFVAVNVTLWFNWLEIITLTEVSTSGMNLLEMVLLELRDPKISGALTMTITAILVMGNSLMTTLLVTVSVIFSFHWLNVIRFTRFLPSALDNPKISGAITLIITVFLTLSNPLSTTLCIAVNVILWFDWLEIVSLTEVSTSATNLLKLFLPALDNPMISGPLALSITVFFIMSNFLVITISVIVSLIFSLHYFNIIILTHVFPSGLKNPQVFGGLTVIITVFLILSSSLLTALSVGVNVTLWFNCLSIIKVTDIFTRGSDVFMSFTRRSRDAKTSFKSEPGAKRLADVVKEKSILLASSTGRTPVYKLLLEEKQINIQGCKSFTFGEKSINCNRNVLFLGAAGAGKSTVINAMINHVLGVRWEDSFRFKIVEEGQSRLKLNGDTSEITAYKLYYQEGFRVNHSLTIIDTPGFGDVEGVDRDKEITEQLRNLFNNQNGIGEIDAVCFVVHSALTELSLRQRWVFDSALSIFGKDVAENIRILVTFADEQQLPVLEAIKVSGVPFPKDVDGLPVHFKFNNSALFADNRSSIIKQMIWSNDRKTSEFWNMGASSMASFFASLANVKTIRLTMTNEVQIERKYVESTVEELEKKIKLGLAELEKIRDTNEKLKEHEAEIRKNENFVLEVTLTKTNQVSIANSGQYITNCMQCYVTCHYPCGIPNDDGKRGCSAMGKNGYCNVCPGKCFWNVHSNQSFRWEYNQVKETQTVKELKDKYEKALGQKLSLQELMKNLISEYKSLQDDVVKLIAEAAKCLNRMKEIVLNPNPLTTLEYIDMLIKGEEQEAKLGWKERVQSLMKMKEKAELLANVEKGLEILTH